MNLQFWKHKNKPAVISNNCYNKLPAQYQAHFEETGDEPTHYVQDDTNFIAQLAMMDILASNEDYSQSTSIIDTPDTTSDWGGFGGGNAEGGGASGDW